MKNISVIVLSVLLAACLISGLIVYRQDRAKLLIKDESIVNLQERLKTSSSEVASLKEEIAKGTGGIERLQSQLTVLRGEKEAAAAEAEALRTKQETKNSEFVKELQNRDERITDLQGQLKASFGEINSLKEEVDKSQREIEGFNRKLSKILGQEVHLAREIDQMKSTYDAMVSDLKKQIQNKEVTIDKLEDKLSITFVDQILFESGRTKITPQGIEILKKVGDILKNVEGKRIQVVGHTDNKPILPEYQYRFPSNWELSAFRAAAVVRLLQKDIGLDASNLEVVGRSFYEPITSNETENGRAQNRRVNIIIAPKAE